MISLRNELQNKSQSGTSEQQSNERLCPHASIRPYTEDGLSLILRYCDNNQNNSDLDDSKPDKKMKQTSESYSEVRLGISSEVIRFASLESVHRFVVALRSQIAELWKQSL
ncbi:MAG: hypothetical protein EZS28_015769 [Streblomastix strix]|uniref:Uncharacterized protein n=1 Tax=Streblomastix strix TaxID=222440 RepID=A0A5J4W184_9EUKA|nr:MAG: hypothetical protein EZS28_015769 [Streblomastix strix]